MPAITDRTGPFAIFQAQFAIAVLSHDASAFGASLGRIFRIDRHKSPAMQLGLIVKHVEKAAPAGVEYRLRQSMVL